MNAPHRVPPQIEPPAGDAPLGVGLLLSRVATELSRASDELKMVQDTMDEVADGALSSTGMMCLQNLDMVEQTVRALAEIVGSLATLAPRAADLRTGELLGTCKLAALAGRLAGVADAEDTSFDLF